MAAYWEIAAHSAYDMFSKYKYLIVDLVFPTSVFWSGNFLLIASFSDQCLLMPFLRMPRCQCQIGPRKPKVLVALHVISEYVDPSQDRL